MNHNLSVYIDSVLSLAIRTQEKDPERIILKDNFEFLSAAYLGMANFNLLGIQKGDNVRNLGAAALLDFADLVPTVEEMLTFLTRHFGEDSGEGIGLIRTYLLACSPTEILPAQVKKLLLLEDQLGFLIGDPVTDKAGNPLNGKGVRWDRHF